MHPNKEGRFRFATIVTELTVTVTVNWPRRAWTRVRFSVWIERDNVVGIQAAGRKPTRKQVRVLRGRAREIHVRFEPR